jgi:hypothetical protein
MNGRDLLELAAKAAEIEYGADRLDCGLSITLPSGHHKSLPRWNPLADDGDALRLAVKLCLRVDVLPWAVDAYEWNERPHDDGGIRADECGNDLSAATRRAITRAAAEIGRRMKHE